MILVIMTAAASCANTRSGIAIVGVVVAGVKGGGGGGGGGGCCPHPIHAEPVARRFGVVDRLHFWTREFAVPDVDLVNSAGRKVIVPVSGTSVRIR